MGFLLCNSLPSLWGALQKAWAHRSQGSECTALCQAPSCMSSETCAYSSGLGPQLGCSQLMIGTFGCHSVCGLCCLSINCCLAGLQDSCFLMTALSLPMSFQNVNSSVPILNSKDPIDRIIEFVPTKAPYDPRWMLAGRPHPSMYMLEDPVVPWPSSFQSVFQSLTNSCTIACDTENSY